MVVGSLNLNKRGGTPAGQQGLTRWLERWQPDLLLFQEAWNEVQSEPIRIPSYQFLAGNYFTACYGRVDQKRLSPIVHSDRWLSVVDGQQLIHTVYFPDTTASARQRFFNQISEHVHAQPKFEHVILGDFNMAPRPEDGLYGEQPSSWTGAGERQALQQLLTENGLVDLYLLGSTTDSYTFEKLNRGRMTRFRCDLALVDRDLAKRAGTTLAVDHRTRRGLGCFTDHSGLIVSYYKE